jgi:uncharacterized NAD(P)/FAD-binding protein YdhS
MNRNSEAFKIAIIGGGFSGACLAAQLLRSGDLSASVILIERAAGSPGRGVAYGTKCIGHLLNVPVQKMSAVADDPTHFLRWAQLHYESSVQPGQYLPRSVYGRYVESILREASEQQRGRFEWKQDEAISITPIDGKAEISLRSGRRIVADKVVLALGNFPPADPKFPGRAKCSPRYVSNPWSPNALEGIGQEKSVLLVGSGLTSVDVVITLRAGGFDGTIHMLSRHGLLPQVHRPAEPRSASWDNTSPRTARGLLRLVRKQVHEAATQNVDWRAVIDSLRPFSQAIWRSLPQQEQGRFLRHVRAYWDAHRHRVAPQIGEMLVSEANAGRMQVHAGRITEYCESADGVELTYRNRGNGESKKLLVGRVINCTGPDSDCRRMNDPLLNDLLRKNLVRPDPLFMGLDTAQDGALIDAHGVTSNFLYTLGPFRKGNLWETTAVPEIRGQAAELALQLISSRKQPSIEGAVPEQVAV